MTSSPLGNRARIVLEIAAATAQEFERAVSSVPTKDSQKSTHAEDLARAVENAESFIAAG